MPLFDVLSHIAGNISVVGMGFINSDAAASQNVVINTNANDDVVFDCVVRKQDAKKPVSPTKKPESPTKKPESPTKKPVSPTKKPESPTKKPVSPTKKPEPPVKKPVASPTKPAKTAKPVSPAKKSPAKKSPAKKKSPAPCANVKYSGFQFSQVVAKDQLVKDKKGVVLADKQVICGVPKSASGWGVVVLPGQTKPLPVVRGYGSYVELLAPLPIVVTPQPKTTKSPAKKTK